MKSLIICLVILASVPAYATNLFQGSIKGAPYTVAAPEKWNSGKVFFHVHGWRPEEAPHEADLNLEDEFYKGLLADGWIIGRTAFLENGVDHDAHTVALRDLKSWIETKFGAIELLILEGESTAGSLVLRIAEQDSDLADGVIAMGPFIDLSNPDADAFLTAKPKLPAILMSNTTEIIDAVSYVALTEKAEVPSSLRPLLRPGHVNVNWIERREALHVMVSTINTGEIKSLTNGTFSVPFRETGTAREDGYLVNKITSVNPYYGNAFIGFHSDELIAAGIEKGEQFEIEAHGKTWSVMFGDSYGDVPAGEWVAFPTADEYIMLVRNHKSATETASLKVGDSVRARAIK
jgi:hypothetical protein